MGNNDDSDGGPMWNRFWNSFGQGAGSAFGEESASGVSGSQKMGPDSLMSPPGAGGVDLSSDVHPNDSASAMGEENSIMEPASSEAGDGTYLFKFVTPSGRVHRFQARYDSFETIQEIVLIKLSGDPFFTSKCESRDTPAEPIRSELDEDGHLPLHIFTPPMPATLNSNPPDVKDFTLAYKDDDDDLVLITTDNDVTDSVKVARHQGRDRVLLVLQGGSTWNEAAARNGDNLNASTVSALNRRRQRELADAQAHTVQSSEDKEKRRNEAANGALFGILPRDMALPAAIGFASFAGIVAACIMKFGRP